MTKLHKKVFHCNAELTMDVIGGKWKPLILYFIGVTKGIRYGQLKRKIPNINERVMNRILRELEANKLVRRETYKENILRVEYSLTPIGETLLPILEQIGMWGIKYNADFQYAEIDFDEEEALNKE